MLPDTLYDILLASRYALFEILKTWKTSVRCDGSLKLTESSFINGEGYFNTMFCQIDFSGTTSIAFHFIYWVFSLG